MSFFEHFRFSWSNLNLAFTCSLTFIFSFSFRYKIITNHFLSLFVSYISQKKEMLIIYLKSSWYVWIHLRQVSNFFQNMSLKLWRHVLDLRPLSNMLWQGISHKCVIKRRLLKSKPSKTIHTDLHYISGKNHIDSEFCQNNIIVIA